VVDTVEYEKQRKSLEKTERDGLACTFTSSYTIGHTETHGQSPDREIMEKTFPTPPKRRPVW
jgi:hypothetical protein